jgi:hypothetical protein
MPGSSPPRLIDSITDVFVILDRPPSRVTTAREGGAPTHQRRRQRRRTNPVVVRRYFLPPVADNSAESERDRMAGISFLVTVLLGGAAFGGLAMMIAGIVAELGNLPN